MRRFPLAATAAAIAIATSIAVPVHAQNSPTAAAAAQPSVPAAPVGRLSNAVSPSAYRLDLTVDPAKDHFSGRVEIEAAMNSASDTVFLHGNDLAVTRAVATAGGKQYAGAWKQVDGSGVVALTFAEPLPAGPVAFAFDYTAPFGSGPAGMFRVKVADDWYSWTQHQSIDARASFPSFDEPGFKTPFTVTLRTPKGLTAVSNAPQVSKSEETGLEVHRFAPTLPLPTYLVAMMVGPFAVIESTAPPTPQRKEPLPLRIISPKPNAAKLSYALENSKTIVALLEDYFGQPFPYPKLDQITSPIMPGAMENAGADLYADGLIVLDEKSPIPRKQAFGMVVSHELAHQWFGDLVTPAWWDDIWLNESFANWMGYRIGGAWRPDLNIGSGATAEGFAAMSTDSLVAGRPIHQKITTNSQIDAAFDSITYGKGGHVVAMIAAFMGDTKFRDGVRSYMAAHKYGNATSADFFRSMAEVSGDARILPAMQSFTDQQGVPLVSFTRSKGGWKVEQSRYARLGTTPPETRWGIPLCVRQGKTRNCQLLDSKSGTISIRGAKGIRGALMPNAGGTGYYRFELPKADWDALIAGADKLSGNEALALNDSLRASFLAGRSSASQLAALARKLANNPDSNANGIALGGLEMLSGSGLLDEGAKAAYRKFVGKLYAPQFKRLGFNPAEGAYAGEDPERTQRRSSVIDALTGTAKDKGLRALLADAGGKFLAGDHAALDSMWYGDTFSALLDRDGVAAARKLFDRALSSQDSSLRPVLLGVIGSSGNKDIGKWVLDDAKDARLRPSERLSLLRGVITSGGTRDIGYSWMKAHLDELLGGSGGIFFAARLPQTLSGFCSVEQAEEFARELRPRFAGKSAEMELERTIERVKSCGLLQNARKTETSRAVKLLK